MKLKLDLPCLVLAVLFGVSPQTCKTTFHTIVATLSPIMMKSTILFPSADEIQRNIPLCFKDFKKTRIVLDCTEIPIQSYRKLCCRVKTYSHYKGTTTIKFMTGVSPAGVITFVSAPYPHRDRELCQTPCPRRVSDKAIFQQSGLLDKLDMYRDEIMVDKGFLIEDLCWEYGINITRPPFLRKSTNNKFKCRKWRQYY